MTPTAGLLLVQLQTEADAWEAAATDPDTDYGSIRKQRAQARRDAIDWCVAQVRVALPAIESEAQNDERSAFAWLDSGAGIPEAA